MTGWVSSILGDLGVAASVVIVGGGMLAAWRATAGLWGRTVGSRRDLARRLDQLAAGVTLRYVEERFGTPAFERAFAPAATPGVPAQPQPSAVGKARLIARSAAAVRTPEARSDAADRRVRGHLRELLFRERHAWLQVLADDHDAVVRFSITVTDPKFRFRTRNLAHGQIDVRLGHTRFSHIPPGWPVEGRSLRIGAHNHEYAEAIWAGYPGFYQHYVISSNEVGTGQFDYSIQAHGPAFSRDGVLDFGQQLPVRQAFDPDSDYARRFRAQTTINTLTILGPAGNASCLAEPRGPDSLQVGVIAPDRRQRRHLRRMIRAANRQAPRTACDPAGPPQADSGQEPAV